MPRPAADRSPPAAQLSLFDVPLPLLQARSAAGEPPAGTTPATPAAPSPPATTTRLHPAEFRHPQADRELRLQGHVVAYALRRARRRSIGFVVGTEGLSVNAPRWVGIGDIEAALQAKAAWILRKLGEQRERGQRLQAARVDWRDGTTLPFLGETVQVMLDPLARGAQLEASPEPAEPRDPSAPRPPRAPRLLRVGLPHTATPPQIRDLVQSWLQRQARQVFEQRCRHFAEQLGVRCTRLSLSSAQTRWGSASASGAIRLNWRLVHFGLATIDYVVAHELAHLREMNHSPRFWDVVRSVMPDYEQAMGPLKHEVLPVFD